MEFNPLSPPSSRGPLYEYACIVALVAKAKLPPEACFFVGGGGWQDPNGASIYVGRLITQINGYEFIDPWSGEAAGASIDYQAGFDGESFQQGIRHNATLPDGVFFVGSKINTGATFYFIGYRVPLNSVN